MYRKARNLNSTPRFINTIILVPAFLGVILPKIVYGITAKNRKKMEMDKANKMNSNHDIPINNTPSTLQSINSKSKTFRQNNKIFDILELAKTIKNNTFIFNYGKTSKNNKERD